MSRVPAPSWPANSCRPSIKPTPSHMTGPMMIRRLMTVMIVAASLGRPPRFVASQSYSGYNATVSESNQHIGMNGRTRTNDQ